jgi:polyhydroxyalkanoate synthase subunit PhaC
MTSTEQVPPTVRSADTSEIPPILGANPFVGLTRRQVAAGLARLWQRVLVEPGVVVARGASTAKQLVEVAIGRNEVAPERGDKRFGDRAWTANPLYHRVMQVYLVQRNAALRLPDDVELDLKSRERARFALSLFTEAAAPTNTLIGNPTALAKAAQTRGQTPMSPAVAGLVRGG